LIMRRDEVDAIPTKLLIALLSQGFVAL
jgi:hypothetical protein